MHGVRISCAETISANVLNWKVARSFKTRPSWWRAYFTFNIQIIIAFVLITEIDDRHTCTSKNDDISIIMRLPCSSFPQRQIENDQWLLRFKFLQRSMNVALHNVVMLIYLHKWILCLRKRWHIVNRLWVQLKQTNIKLHWHFLARSYREWRKETFNEQNTKKLKYTNFTFNTRHFEYEEPHKPNNGDKLTRSSTQLKSCI